MKLNIDNKIFSEAECVHNLNNDFIHDDFLNKLTSVRPNSSFTDEILNNAKLISVNDDFRIVGSAAMRIQKYPGDIDLLEAIIGNDISSMTKNFSKVMRQKVKKIINTPNVWLVELKAGYDERFNFPIGVLNKVHNIFIFLLDENLSNNIIKTWNFYSDDEKKFLRTLYDIKTASLDDYYQLKDIIKKYKILRWNAKEILDGKKKQNDIVFDLKSSLMMKTLVKIDIIAIIDDLYTEISNFYLLGYVHGNMVIPIDVGFNFSIREEIENSIKNAIRDDILLLLNEGNYYKILKRMWALCRFDWILHKSELSKKILLIITPFLASDIGILGQVKSSIESFNLVNYKLKEKTYAIFNNRYINKMKYLVSKCFTLSSAEMNSLLTSLEHKNLSYVKLLCNNKLSALSQIFMKDNGLLPIDDYFLP